MSEKTIIRINASSLRNSTCMLRWYRQIVQGYYQPNKDAKAVYGVGVHTYIDSMYKTGGHVGISRDKALAVFNVPKWPVKQQQWLEDENHFFMTCYHLWNEYVTKETQFELCKLPTGDPATEITFSIPFLETEQFLVKLEGTIDKIGKFKGGCYAVGDWKTTSKWDTKSYLSDYETSSQLKFYVLALKLMARLEPESMLGQIGATRVGAFIDGIFLKPKVTDNTYGRSEVFQFTEVTMAEYERLLECKIQELIGYAFHQEIPLRQGLLNGACGTGNYKCEYYNICRQQDMNVASMLLARDFKQKPYNPLKHNEV